MSNIDSGADTATSGRLAKFGKLPTAEFSSSYDPIHYQSNPMKTPTDYITSTISELIRSGMRNRAKITGIQRMAEENRKSEYHVLNENQGWRPYMEEALYGARAENEKISFALNEVRELAVNIIGLNAVDEIETAAEAKYADLTQFCPLEIHPNTTTVIMQRHVA